MEVMAMAEGTNFMPIMETIFSIIIWLITIIGFLFKIYKESMYYFAPFKGKNTEFETYEVTDIFQFYTQQETYHLGRIKLVKSTIKNAVGFMDIRMGNEYKEKVELFDYSFGNNCLHNIIAPGFLLFDDKEDSYHSDYRSNGYESIKIKVNTKDDNVELLSLPKWVKASEKDIFRVTIEFEFPINYSGPIYEQKILIFIKSIGLVKAVTIWKNKQKVVYSLHKFSGKPLAGYICPIVKGNKWVYKIEYDDGVGANKININMKKF